MSRRLFRLAFVSLLLGSPALRADDETPAKEASAIPPYTLKNRSSFSTPSEKTRVPFWPVGWVKRKEGAGTSAQVAAAPKVTLDEKGFRVSSILLGSGTIASLAVINGRAYSEGELIRLPKGTLTGVRIRVQRINDGSVILEHDDQKLIVSLRRPELNQRRPEEELLDPNR